jgi:asparagine synthase (glutamine-hydrolysing)
MSGIAGLLYLDGRPVDAMQVHAMAASLQHRGPDGGGVWYDGSVGLVHRLLHVTPESLHEELPRETPDGRIVLTCDARIDNREDLLRQLELRSGPSATITDSELILAAYERWGEQCVRNLIGDFSFAIWDGPRNTLFCARDYYGTKPLYYHHAPGRHFVFGSEIKALLTIEAVPDRLNEDQVLQFMGWDFGHGDRTFYQEIFRLPAAHYLTVSADDMRLRRYWSPDEAKDVHFTSNAEYEDAFRDVFFEAVRCRLRSAFPVGSMLSGGIDSSSVACTARKLLHDEGRDPLHTYSLVFDATPDCDERPFINTALQQGGFEPHLVLGDDISPLEDIDRVHWLLDEPAYICLYALAWGKYRAASRNNVRVLLDGLMGDEVLSAYAPMWHMTDLARRGRLLQLFSTVRQYGRNMQRSPWAVVRRDVLRQLAPPLVARAYRAVRGRPAFERNVGGATAAFLAGATTPAPRWTRSPVVRRSARELHYSAVNPKFHHVAFGIANPLSTSMAVDVRYPFTDRRLVEFSVGLPVEQKFAGAWPRSIIRRSLGGILPEEIRWRRGKGHLTTWYKRGIANVEPALFEATLAAPPAAAARIIDYDGLRRVWDEHRTGFDDTMTSAIWMPYIMAYWMAHRTVAAAAA